MKIVAINGSGSGAAGATGQTLEGVAEGARQSGANVAMFLLNELTISPGVVMGGLLRRSPFIGLKFFVILFLTTLSLFSLK